MTETFKRHVPPIISNRLSELETLCARYGVARLEVFGSVMTEDFDAVTSDLDFLVTFLPDRDLGPWMKEFFEFEEELGRLFGREIDVIFGTAIRNPYFKRNIEPTRTLLYAA